MVDLSELTQRFLAWPLPDSVCSDLCATMPSYAGRTGTNLMTAVEAASMLVGIGVDDLLAEVRALRAERDGLKAHAARVRAETQEQIDEMRGERDAALARVGELEKAGDNLHDSVGVGVPVGVEMCALAWRKLRTPTPTEARGE